MRANTGPADGISSSIPPAAASRTPSPGSSISSIGLKKDDKPIFDSIIVVTDRRLLDQQIRDTIKQFAQVGATSAMPSTLATCASSSRAARRSSSRPSRSSHTSSTTSGTSIADRHFAIVIDEAHSSQGGKTAAAVNAALGDAGEADDETTEDAVNRIMESRKILPERELLRVHGDAEEQDA